VIAETEYERRLSPDFGPAWSIREHLPTLQRLANECETAYELGVGAVVSTWAFINSGLRRLTSVDIEHPSVKGGDIELAQQAAAERGIQFTLDLASTLDHVPEVVDLTFIDSLHTYEQLLAELRRYAPSTRKYIALHDTEAFGQRGELPGSRGLVPAVDQFLHDNPGWFVKEHYANNNGLTVLARRSPRASVKAFTGFVDNAFAARHLDQSQFRDLGARLKDALGPRLHAFDDGWRLRDCWAYPLLQQQPFLQPSDPNPPADRFTSKRDAVISNIVLLQRFEWAGLAAQIHRSAEVLVWVEYSILKQSGVTPEILNRYLDRIEETPVRSLTLPGVWDRNPLGDSTINWRFAGSTWMCPRFLVQPLTTAVKSLTQLRAQTTGTITWDVNTLAQIEQLGLLPMQWYRGNHDATQFTGFAQ
jgi:hypothetical protein